MGKPGTQGRPKEGHPSGKLQLGIYWCASCGGCDIAVLDINEKILDVAALADIKLWPIALDFKYEDVRALPDKALDVSFINGALRNSEQVEIVELLRKKSKTVVAFGSCACWGGIPALANLFDRNQIFERVYGTSPSTVNPNRSVPALESRMPEGTLTLPTFYNTVYKLDDIIPVEYYLPGCPPPAELVAEAVDAIATGNLPPAGSVLAKEKALCDSCPRERAEKKVTTFRRVHEVQPDPDRCLLDQGIICCGPATRDGCGARCLEANMPCRGCFGPTPEAVEQGAKMLSAVGSIIEGRDEAEIKRVAAQVVDPAGTFYRFGLAASLLHRSYQERSLKEGVELDSRLDPTVVPTGKEAVT